MDNVKVQTCVDNLRNNPQLVCLTSDPVTSDLILLHHLTEIGGSITSPSKHMVALNNFGSSASVMRFKSADDLLTGSSITKITVPPLSDFESYCDSFDFKKIDESSGSDIFFRSFVLLPPHIEAAFL